MPSPFPGMNPYLEHPHVWHDFHQTYIVKLRNTIVAELPPSYFVLIRLRAVESHLPKPMRRKLGYLEVQDCKTEKVVTVIELLSPSEKADGEDRENYLARRRELLNSGVNLVELDFLRGGSRLQSEHCPPCAYYAMVNRSSTRPTADLWPIQLRDRLPHIPVPLRPGDGESVVDLQTVLHEVYDGAGYAIRIYTHDPEPKLAPADAKWAKELLAAAK
jgi:hypothetical protein